MASTSRPISPNMQVYHWYVNMVASILHRATGVALVVGTVVVVCGLVKLAGGEEGFAQFHSLVGSPIGMVLMLGWSWALFYHLCNGIRHLIQDGGAGYRIPQIIRSSWLAVIGSVVLTVVVWIYVLSAGGGA